MALPKPRTIRTFSEEHRLEILFTEHKIDEKIRCSFRFPITVLLRAYPSLKVRREIVRRYRHVGWDLVMFCNDQQEGSSVTLR